MENKFSETLSDLNNNILLKQEFFSNLKKISTLVSKVDIVEVLSDSNNILLKQQLIQFNDYLKFLIVNISLIEKQNDSNEQDFYNPLDFKMRKSKYVDIEKRNKEKAKELGIDLTTDIEEPNFNNTTK